MNPLNEAAFDIQNGNYVKAISTLKLGLTTMRRSLRSVVVDNNSASDSLTAGSSPSIVRCEFLSSRPDCSFVTVDSNDSSLQLYDSLRQYMVFCDPIVCKEEEVESKNYDFQTSSTRSNQDKKGKLLAYVMIFNLALAHHLLAIQQKGEEQIQQGNLDVSNHSNKKPKNKEYYLKKAVVFYEQSYRILIENELDLGPLHLLAVTNNLGHVHHANGNESLGEQCTERLLKVIMYIIDRGSLEQMGDDNKSRFSSFIQNAFEQSRTQNTAPTA